MDEDKWSKAKYIAEKQGRGGDYAYITGIYKKMKGGIKKKSKIHAVLKSKAGEAKEFDGPRPVKQKDSMTRQMKMKITHPPKPKDEKPKKLRQPKTNMKKRKGELTATSKKQKGYSTQDFAKSYNEILVGYDDLLKAIKGQQKPGAKYYKRVPKAGGGYVYFYNEAQYKKHLK